MSNERANERRGKTARLVKLPGKPERRTSDDPRDIARKLRATSALGKKEARLAAIEAKMNG